MANALFAAYKENMLGTGTRVDIDADTIKDELIDHGVDIPLPATDDFLDDILAGAREDTSPAYASKTITGGVFDAADSLHATVAAGPSVESFVIFKDTGADATSNLMVFIDTATGLPVTPNGGDITIVFDAGANKIFAV